jgi:folate-binding protein YgfZ
MLFLKTSLGPGKRCSRSPALRRYCQQPSLFSTEPSQIRYTRLPTRSLIEISNDADDVRSFINGLVAANTKDLQYTSSSYYTVFLNAAGRVLHDVFIYPAPSNFQRGTGGLRGQDEPDHFLIEVDTEEAGALLKHLKKHRLQRSLAFRLLDQEEGPVYALWNDKPWQDPFVTLKPTLDPLRCWKLDQRPNVGARCILRPGSEMEGYFGPANASPEDYKIHRMLNGIAEGSNEILPGIALPQESNIDLLGGIDFRKGCYLGQELTIRTHHTGVVRKRILPVQIYEIGSPKPALSDESGYRPDAKFDLPPPGSEISRVSARKGRSVGKWLGGVGNIGLALCRLGAMTDSKLTRESPPYDPQQEFEVVWDRDQKDKLTKALAIKAFVPHWMTVALEDKLRGPTSQI